MADLVLDHLTIKYGDVTAVDDVSVSVAAGEFLTLLGPSGCGKSTTLFAVSGLNHATSGSIRIGDTILFDGERKISVAPEHRNIGLVFQSYALWPHKTVADNLGFPLQLRKMGRAERDERIKEALGLVEMLPYAERYPFELSGGQQQRVALARALVYRPRLLLLDEPLSNLDAKLRERARVWLRELQERLNVTTIYVTHDQAEALAVSDRVAVMSMGRMRQIGAPKEIYDHPADAFVADFIGSANFLKARMVSRNGEGALVQLGDGTRLSTRIGEDPTGEDVFIAIRPERIDLVDGPGENVLKVNVEQGTYLGSVYQYEVAGAGERFRIQTTHALDGGEAYVRLQPQAAILFSSGPASN